MKTLHSWRRKCFQHLHFWIRHLADRHPMRFTKPQQWDVEKMTFVRTQWSLA